MPKPAISEPLSADPLGLRLGGAAVDNDQEDEAFQPLNPKEAEALRAKLPVHSPWRVVVAQGVVGLLLAALLGVLGEVSWWWSALYGTTVVVVPGAVMARGLKKSLGLPPGAVLMRFAVWELAKLFLAVAMMVAAPKLISGLSWWVLLLALVVCLKVNWVVWVFDQRRPVQQSISS